MQNLNISRYSNDKSLVSNTKVATLKAILKYRNHPSIITIQNECEGKDSFNFYEIDQKQIEKYILKLDISKVSQSSDISIKVVKENTVFLVIFSAVALTIP